MYFFQFNTGRSYSNNGQIIKCLLDEDSSAEDFNASIWFVDTTREVAGKILDTVGISPERVMSYYDSLNYEELSFENSQIQKILKHNFYLTGSKSTKEDIGVQVNASGDVVINEPLRKVQIAGMTVFTNSSNELFVELPNKRIYRMMNENGLLNVAVSTATASMYGSTIGLKLN